MIYKTFNKGVAAIPMHLQYLIFQIELHATLEFLNCLGKIQLKNMVIKKDHLLKNLDKEWVKNYGVTNSTLAEDWIDKEIN